MRTVTFAVAIVLMGTAAWSEEKSDLPPGVSAAEEAFKRSIVEAKEKLRAALEHEKQMATMAGNLEVALAIRDRILEHDVAGTGDLEDDARLRVPRGRVDLSYSNGTKRRYDFSVPGRVQFTATAAPGGSIKPLPRIERATVHWHREGDELVGYVNWYPDGNEQKLERLVVAKDGRITTTILSTLAPGATSEGKLGNK